MQTPRHRETESAYSAFKETHKTDIERLQSFNFDEETILRTFTFWVIIKNRFPYDQMARTNDMLVSKRPLYTHYEGTEDEQTEYHKIINLLAEENYYDAMIENFPKVKSVKKFAHTHLVRWHDTEDQEGK